MISISVQPTIYSPTIESMRTNQPWAGPKGVFYLLDGSIVPYTPKPTVIKIETDRIGEPINLEVVQTLGPTVGVDPRANQRTYTIVATSGVTTVGVQLGRGINTVTATVTSRPGEVSYLIVKATTIVAFWEAFARVLYTGATTIIDEQKRAISSALATRLMEPYLPFQDLLPDIQSLQIMATRFVARGLLHSVGTNTGVTDLIKALTLGTPVYKDMDKDTFDLYPALDPWTKTASQFGGQEAHIWIPNIGIASWLAFLGYINNQPDIFEIMDVTETEVVIKFQGELQRHQFDFDQFGTDFLTSLARSECFKSIVIAITMKSHHLIRICAASYTFDLFIPADHPIGDNRLAFDENVPFDSGLQFDSDPVDPFSDGWVGLSLTGRFEQDSNFPHVLDTFVMPSTLYSGPICGYPSLYTQMVVNHRFDIEVDVNIQASGAVQGAFLWTIQSPNTTLWDIYVNSDGTLYSVSGSTRTPSNFKVTKPDLSEAAFAITNAGVLQVIPPVGGENLNDELILRAPDSFWEVGVTNSDQIITMLEFSMATINILDEDGDVLTDESGGGLEL